MQLFFCGIGIQVIVGEGLVLLQVQNVVLIVNVQKGVKISINENEVLIIVLIICLVVEDGSYIKIGGGVIMGIQGDIKLLLVFYQWGGLLMQ